MADSFMSDSSAAAAASHADLKMALALEELRFSAGEASPSHSLLELFTQSLGWQPISDHLIAFSPTFSKGVQHLQQTCLPIAYRDGVIVWQVMLAADFQLTATRRTAIYLALVQAFTQVASEQTTETQPLVIFVDATKKRSLWCQSLQETALYVADEPDTLWTCRLRRLAQHSKGLFPTEALSVQNKAYQAFEQLVEGLYRSTSGISNSNDRRRYAVLTLQRLIFVQSLQQKGWINRDRWYLQTRFGDALQRGSNLFFRDCLKPLYESLSLPEIERPVAMTKETGEVPFVGPLLEKHPLEQRYPDINVSDQPFEDVLGWLSEQVSADTLNPLMSKALSGYFEQYWANHTQPTEGYVGASALARMMSDRTLDSWLCNQINLQTSKLSHASAKTQAHSDLEPSTETVPETLNDLLFNATARTCRYLIQEVLPELRILDPACGSGHLLIAANQRLLEVFSILTGYSEQTKDTQLKLWRSGLTEALQPDSREPAKEWETKPNLLLRIQQRIFKNNLYGVDISAGAVETAHFQLLLHLVAIAQTPQEISPLVDLSFNILPGNSLIGLVDVDEEGFDQIDSSGTIDMLQGNLLQPLAADGYQTILAEKNLALEHYKSRNRTLAKARHIPDYARASLLKEEIAQLDIRATRKLNAMLLSHMSQQLGIQYKTMQLDGSPQRRLLTLEDIDVLQPFHWGYHFNTIIQQGGFDCILCAPPWGAFKPTAEEFFEQFQDLAEAKGMNAKTLKTSKQALAKGDPEIAGAWLFYQEQYAYVADYFYRSEQYMHQNPTVNGKLVRNQLVRERLFSEQCFNLLAIGGIGAVLSPEKWTEAEKARTLCHFFQTATIFSEIQYQMTQHGVQEEGSAWMMTWNKSE